MTSTYTTNKSIEKPAYNDYATNATGWTSPVNADWDVIDRSLGGVQVMNPTGVSGSVTLTTAQYQAPIIVIGTSISGVATLTDNVTYQIPSGVGGVWTVYNNTTGSFTVTISSGGGGTSVLLQQGYATALNSDGTNIRISDTRPAVPAGSNTQIQYNNSGLLGASANLTFSGTQLNINQPAGYAGAKVQASSSTNSNIFAAEMPAGGPGTGFISEGSASITNYDHFGAYKIGSGTRLFGVASDGAITSATTITAGSTIKSSSGGFIFPDNTTQTTAATTPTQAWVNTGNVFNTTYTNSNAYTITALVSLVYSGYSGGFTVYVNGVGIATGGGNLNYKYGETITFPIPAGATYSVSGSTCYAAQWAEFR